jgi:GMP synthase-like glutamine amidotransferase
MASALILQTQDNCPPGLLANWSASRGVALDVLRVDRWPELPDPSGYSFAVLLGSDESATGSPQPWVERELEWIRQADASGLPLLGICFGAQALAVALGGSISRLATPELAWIDLETSDDGQIPAGTWLALHDDRITLPPSAYELARNDFGPQRSRSGDTSECSSIPKSHRRPCLAGLPTRPIASRAFGLPCSPMPASDAGRRLLPRLTCLTALPNVLARARCRLSQRELIRYDGDRAAARSASGRPGGPTGRHCDRHHRSGDRPPRAA